MRLIALTSDVALQLGLSSLEPDLLVVYADDPEGAPDDADVALIDLGGTARGLDIVAGLRARGVDVPCVVVGDSDTGGDPTVAPLLRPFTLDGLKDALLALGTPYVRARGGEVPLPVTVERDATSRPEKISRRERKEREREARTAAALQVAEERRRVREDLERQAAIEREAQERAEEAAREERERRERAARESAQRAEEQARIERAEAERAAREERERAAEAARLEKAARAQRERAEQAAREAEEAARRELERAIEAARRERLLEDAARRELADLAARAAPSFDDAPIQDADTKRSRKERQRAERALKEAEAARAARAKAEAAAEEERQRAVEAARAAEEARRERERVEREREEHEEQARIAREERERLEQAAREELERQEAEAREERQRAIEAARAEAAAREARQRAEAEAREERRQQERAERAAREQRLRTEREEREREMRVEKARRAALARAEDMARREAHQTLLREQREAIKAREALTRRPEPRRPVSPPEAFVVPSSHGGPMRMGSDLVSPEPERVHRRRRLSDIAGRGRSASGGGASTSSPTADLTKRVETAIRAGTEIGSILEMLPGLGTPVSTAEALLAEVRDTLGGVSAAVYGRDGDLFSILAGQGLTPVERAGSVTSEHGLFREVVEGSGVLIDPVDLARGLVAGVACASANVLLAAPLWNEGRCHGVVVVGGDGFDDEALRALCAIAERAAPSLALAQLLDGLRSALT